MKSLNRIFRTIWSEALNTWIAVSEIMPAKGKSRSCLLNRAKLPQSKAESGSYSRRNIRLRLLPLTIVILGCFSLNAQANPYGAQVVNGSASLNQSANTLTVTNSPNAIINWQGFSIGNGETTKFVQQSSSSSILNRVTGTDPSVLLGTLTSNGRVFLINPAGIMVGQGARIDVGGFVASTLNLSNANFLAGKLNFDATPNAGAIQNNGSITTPEGGTVYLVAPQIENNGIINTPKGETILAAGDTVQLLDTGTPGVSVQITGSSSSSTNLGKILADSGQIGMVGAVVKNTGTISANSVVRQGGKVFLRATKSIDAGGTISAQGVGGGTISVLADKTSGAVNVTGTLDASAPNSGNGGQIETSAAQVNIADSAHVTTASAMGLVGTWLIDPVDFTIAATGGDITGTALSTSLGSGNVTILSSSGTTGTAGNINVNDTVTWSANTLTLNAYNNINVNTAMNGSGTARLALLYGQGASNGVIGGITATYNINAPVNLPAGNNFSTQLGSGGTPINYTVITSLGSATDATTAPGSMTLQGMETGLSGNYVLGSNIDASATSAWNAGNGFTPIGVNPAGVAISNQFNGVFDGLGHTINNLSVNWPSMPYDGLFGVAWAQSVIRNVGLIGLNVHGSYGVGGLVGATWGLVSNSYSTGMVSGSGGQVGGLIGETSGSTISNSYSTATISGTTQVGGLIGATNVSSISNSYATGNVSGTSETGGLIGGNYSTTIAASYAVGRVSGASYAGGLVGKNTGTVSNSFYNSDFNSTLTGIGSSTNDVPGTVWGMTTAAMQNSANFTSATGTSSLTDHSGNGNFNPNWIFTTTAGASGWVIVNADGSLNANGTPGGGTLPMLASEYSTTINNAHQLQLMAMALGASYTLGQNINASATGSGGDVWGSAGFVPVGYSLSSDNGHPNPSTNFTGSFNGQGHSISNLTINLPSSNHVGFFGYTYGGSLIENIGLAGGSVVGNSYVGNLVGRNFGTVSNSYATGSVSGVGIVGGLVGQNDGLLSNTYASGGVFGSSAFVGGLVGVNNNGTASINNSYAMGSVSGTTSNIGGLAGLNQSGASINNSFWGITTSGQGTSAGGVGMSNSDMMMLANFNSSTLGNGSSNPGWNIANTGGSGAVWRIYDGQTTPLLTSFLTPITLTPVYNGTTQTLTSIAAYTANISNPVNGNIIGTSAGLTLNSSATAGTHTAVLNNFSSNQQGYDISYATNTITGTGSTANQIIINNALTWSGSNSLTVDAANIVINAALTGGGSISLNSSGAISLSDATVSSLGNMNIQVGTSLFLTANAQTTLLNSFGTQTITFTGYGVNHTMTLAGGNNSSYGGAAANVNASGFQTISYDSSGGSTLSINVDAGSATNNSQNIYAYTSGTGPTVCTSCATNNSASIRGNAGQNISSTSITLNGGSGGIGNNASISNNSSSVAQTITVTQTSAATGAINLTGGTGIGYYSPTYPNNGTDSGASINSQVAQTINAASITLNGGGNATSNGGAIISGNTSMNISTTGNVVMTGGASSSTSAQFSIGSPAVIGAQTNANIYLSIGGSLSMTGGSGTTSPVLIGNAMGTPVININATSVSMTSGAAASRIGTLSGGPTGSLTMTATSGSITQDASSQINVASLITSSIGGTSLAGSNIVGNFTASNSSSGNIVLNNISANLTLGNISNTVGSVSVNNAGALNIIGTNTATNIKEQSTTGVTLGTAASFIASGTGDAIILNAGYGNFINNSTAAGSVLSSAAGRWLVFSTSPLLNNFGGLDLQSGFTQYGATYIPGDANLQGTGNGLIYSTAQFSASTTQPTVTTVTTQPTVITTQPVVVTVQPVVNAPLTPTPVQTVVQQVVTTTVATASQSLMASASVVSNAPPASLSSTSSGSPAVASNVVTGGVGAGAGGSGPILLLASAGASIGGAAGTFGGTESAAPIAAVQTTSPAAQPVGGGVANGGSLSNASTSGTSPTGGATSAGETSGGNTSNAVASNSSSSGTGASANSAPAGETSNSSTSSGASNSATSAGDSSNSGSTAGGSTNGGSVSSGDKSKSNKVADKKDDSKKDDSKKKDAAIKDDSSSKDTKGKPSAKPEKC